MNFKAKLIIGFLLFTSAFVVRYGSYLDTSNVTGRPMLAYQTIGTGGDPDYQLYCAKTYDTGNIEAMMHYDYFFLCPSMAFILQHFEFVKSLEVMAVVTMIFGSLAVVLPFTIFSYLNKYEVGGLLASLLLLINPVMINNSDGRFYIYPLVVFFFSIFIWVYLMALYKRSNIWLFALGSIAIVQGISKPFLYVNDMALFLVFPFLFCLTEIKWRKTFPFIHLHWNWADFKRALAPTIIYFLGIIGFEILHGKATNGAFFLTDLFMPNAATSKTAILGKSLNYDGPFIHKIDNILCLLLLGIELLITYIPYVFYFLMFGIISLIVSGKNAAQWFWISITALIGSTFFGHWFIYRFLYPNPDVQVLPYTHLEVFEVVTLLWFLMIVALRTKYGLALVASHIFYFGALALCLGAVSQPQLFVTLIMWLTVLIAYSYNVAWPRVIAQMSPRVYQTALGLIGCIFIWPLLQQANSVGENIERAQMQKQYLQWVKTVIPEDGYILGSFDDSLPLTSNITERQVIFNAIYVATMIPPHAYTKDLYQHDPLSDYIALQATTSATSRFYVLDNSTEKWAEYLQKGTSGNYPAEKYVLIESAYNSQLGRRVYYISLKK